MGESGVDGGTAGDEDIVLNPGSSDSTTGVDGDPGRTKIENGNLRDSGLGETDADQSRREDCFGR